MAAAMVASGVVLLSEGCGGDDAARQINGTPAVRLVPVQCLKSAGARFASATEDLAFYVREKRPDHPGIIASHFSLVELYTPQGTGVGSDAKFVVYVARAWQRDAGRMGDETPEEVLRSPKVKAVVFFLRPAPARAQERVTRCLVRGNKHPAVPSV